MNAILAILLVVTPLAAGPGPGLSRRVPAPPEKHTVSIEPIRDATLIEDPEGAWANGAGPALFAGRTSSAGARRAVLTFDVAGALPPGAILDSATLTLFLTPSNPAPRRMVLHRVLADWGEGPSASSGGGGASSQTGDVTWIHTFYDDELWVRPGGQFVPRVSAGLEVGGSGYYTWGDMPLVQDVRLWQRAPGRNFGWILIGDESEPQTAKSFASRENPDPILRPVLSLTYHIVGGD